MVDQTLSELPESPPPELRYRRGLRLGSSLRKLGESRHVIWNLGVRELRVRYNQAVLGFAWALLTPVILMVVFSVFIKGAAKLSVATHGVSYPVFLYTGLLAWTFFASAVGSAANILVSNPLLNKVYAPREVFPLATMGTSAVDAVAATLVLGVLFVLYQDWPQPTSYWAPLLVLILVCFAVGVGLFFSALTVYLRDLRQILPLVLQVGLFVTPVIYGLNRVPERWRVLYVVLNPVAMVITELRETVLWGHQPNLTYVGLASLSSVFALVIGYAIFKQLETGFADVS
jgi:ABC-2 type transport system permease protein/lipopolysaccharide transport system permease protein